VAITLEYSLKMIRERSNRDYPVSIINLTGCRNRRLVLVTSHYYL